MKLKSMKERRKFPDKYQIYQIIGFLILSLLLLENVHAQISLPLEKVKNFEGIYQNLEFDTIEKKHVKIKDLKAPIILINFWASWCIPCLEEMPRLIDLTKKYKQTDFSMILVNTDQEDALKKIQKIKNQFKIPKEVLIVSDTKYQIADRFKFSSIPVTLIFKKGKLIQFDDGPLKVPPDLW